MPHGHPWGTHALPEHEDLVLALGPTEIRLRRQEGELRARVTREGSVADEDEGWTRWAAGDLERVAVEPVFPDRPLVVEPEVPFWLLGGGDARIYVRVPLWLHLEGLGRARHSLLRVPSMALSDTWWGTPEEGELCYWLGTHARRAIAPELYQPHLAICPLQLVNRAEEDLHVDKIALRVAFLSLYQYGEALWADETRVLYLGEDEGSRLEMAGRAPTEAPGAGRITPPAEPMSRGFRARTFRRLRHLTGGLFG